MNKEKSYQLSYEIIQEMTNPTYFARGENYQRWGMVEKGWITDSGLKAKVRGSYRPLYLVEITITDTLKLYGSCTCPIGNGCKHCVAVCLQYLYEPDFFIKLNHSKSDAFDDDYLENIEKINIQEQYQLDPISIHEYVTSLSKEELKARFIELWNRFTPNSFENVIDPNYPFEFWLNQIVDIIEFDNSTKKLGLYNNSRNWFSPLELLTFLGETQFYIPILHNWCKSYTRLGRFLKEEFKEIGLDKDEFDFDSDLYFLSDNDLDDYEDRWDYDYDSTSMADDYFSQYKKIFTEIGQFYEILISKDQSELAQVMFEYGFKWFLSLPLYEHSEYGLDNLHTIQEKFAEQLKSAEIMTFKGQKRIDYLVNMYLEFKSIEIKEKIFYELNQMVKNLKKQDKFLQVGKDQINLREVIQQIWKKVLRSYKFKKTNDDFSFLVELNNKFIRDEKRYKSLVTNTLFNIQSHSKSPWELLSTVFEYYQSKSHESIEWLYSVIIRGELNGQKINSDNYKKNKKFLCSNGFEWFLKYYLPKGTIDKIIELCRNIVRYSPVDFGFNHYSMIINYSKHDSNFQKEFSLFLKNEFLPKLVNKHQYGEVNKIFLAEKDYSNAIKLTHSHFDEFRAWNIIKKLHTVIYTKNFNRQSLTISSDERILLFGIINKYINESMKIRSRYRPDNRISQAVQLKKRLYDLYDLKSEEIKWFAQFCKKYKRFRNLRDSLKKLGIEMV